MKKVTMKEIKGGVKVVMAKTATTNRTQVDAEQHLCWYLTIDSSFESLKRQNQPWEILSQ